MGLSTHVLDQKTGLPARGLSVRLYRGDRSLGTFVTDEDGRCKELLTATTLEVGVYTLIFEAGAYFGADNVTSFYSDIPVQFVIDDKERHYHVPLLLSPFGYSTYRGS